MYTVLTILLCAVLYCLIYILLKLYAKWDIIKFYMKHNGPRYFPYFGNIVFSGNNVLATYLKVRRDYGMPYAIWIHDDLCYATDDPKEIKVILNHPDCFNKATFYSKVVESCLFDGFALIPISEIDKWKLYRRFAAKSMRPAMWKDFLPVFHEYSQRLNRSFKKSKQFTNFDDFFASLNNIVFQTFMVNFLGMENYHMRDIDNFTTGIQKLLAVLGRRTTFQRVIPDYFWKYHTENGKDFCNIINTIRKQVYEIIQMKRQAFQKETNNDTLNSTKFLNSYLQDEGTVFTDEEIFHQVYFLAAASTETSALSVCFILLQLGMDQDVQEKVHQEIIDLLGTDKEIALQDLNKLKYTEQVIFETLRIYPVLPFLGRQATSNIRLGSPFYHLRIYFLTCSPNHGPRYEAYRLASDQLRYHPRRYPAWYLA
ncbi:cytochrome P450 4e3-like isoform X2 [Rhynchophorus ferrugineus]|uniref:cytochrome P450 4e3-like isoform X2 n=1 Tax=Rhynchophorus ferrugineus TaxID=354439 RepID=UPI003FCEDB23